jgi:beta-glucosidase
MVSHGLSYTTFAFSNLSISEPSSHNVALTVDVSATVTNTGPVTGSEVVQLYITLPENGLTTPKLQLRGFVKLKDVAPGASSSVTIHLDKYAVSFWDVRKASWKADAGKYKVSVGKSSYDIQLEGEFELKGKFTWVGL